MSRQWGRFEGGPHDGTPIGLPNVMKDKSPPPYICITDSHHGKSWHHYEREVVKGEWGRSRYVHRGPCQELAHPYGEPHSPEEWPYCDENSR